MAQVQDTMTSVLLGTVRLLLFMLMGRNKLHPTTGLLFTPQVMYERGEPRGVLQTVSDLTRRSAETSHKA